MDNKFNIHVNGVVQGQCIGDNQTIVANYNNKFDCPHCKQTSWLQFENGVQKCPLCHKEITKGE